MLALASGGKAGSSPDMALALHASLVERPESTLRFLRAALGLETPTVPALVAAGVPHWDADEFVRRLEAAGEMRIRTDRERAAGDVGDDLAARGADAKEACWLEEARRSYVSLIDALPSRPARALELTAPSDRPREKALARGIEALSDGELLALLLRTGHADEGVIEFAARLLQEHDGLVGLARRDIDTLAEAHGLGPAKAAELAAAFELARRLAQATLRERPSLKTPEAVAELLGPLAVSLAHEELWCLPLDPQSRLIGRPRVVSKGDVDGTDAGPRAFFRLVLAAGATSCIAVHNHPGGDPTPSSADRGATRRLAEAGRVLDLPLVDHVVLGSGGRFASIRRTHPECF